MKRIAIDVGGTFTDCLVVTEDGTLDSFKSPTDPAQPEAGVLRCLGLAADTYGQDTTTLLGEVSVIVHGTTLALNTLVTDSGPRVGMITTEGFRDILEIRRGLRDQRVSLYNLFIPPYEPLVPRHLRLGVPERVLYTGEVEHALDEEATRAAVASLREAGAESVAVCFLHSYANAAHEERAAAICAEEFGPGRVTTSHDVLPAWREFERFSTTVLSAYLSPAVTDYITNLQRRLTEHGFDGALLMMLANGLVQTVEEVADRAIDLINSGPSAAPFGATHAADGVATRGDLISVDMGGTSFDICVIRGGDVPTTTEQWVEDHRVAIKMVDVHSIGAGGGSIATVDSLGLLRVGPKSAGATPGPACYGKGGTEATVTDANLVLGYIPSTSLAAGRLTLDAEAGRAALGRLGEALGLEPEQAADAVYETVTATMADKIMEVCTRQGHDVRDFSLVVGGGAGPLHGAALAERLDIAQVIVPSAAGLFSAFGMLTMGVGRDFVRSYPVRADQADPAVVAQLYAEMESDARAAFARMGVSEADLRLERTSEMRYARQFHELETPIPAGSVDAQTLEQALDRFHHEHHDQYGFSMPHLDVELLTFRLRATAPRPEVDLHAGTGGSSEAGAAQTGSRTCWWRGAPRDTPIFAAARLRPGDALSGPAVIEASTTTVLVPPAFECVVNQSQHYVLRRKDA